MFHGVLAVPATVSQFFLSGIFRADKISQAFSIVVLFQDRNQLKALVVQNQDTNCLFWSPSELVYCYIVPLAKY